MIVAKGWRRLLLFAGAALVSTLADASGYSIRQLGAEQLRLKTIGYRLGATNWSACKAPRMLSGLVLHDLTQYQLPLRAAVSRAFSLHSGIGVLGVVPGSVASRAGIKVDDEIIAVNGMSIEDDRAVNTATQSYRRMDRFAQSLETALRPGSADLLVRRRDQRLHIRLAGQRACGGEALVINSSELNAWSDGTRIFVSSAMMRLANDDDELAFVVAHEMAHNILGHSSSGDTHGLLGLFGFGAAKVRREEILADTVAVPLMNSGGYAPLAAEKILETMRHVLWWNISLDHPGFNERIRTVGWAIARLNPGRTATARAASVSSIS